MAVGGEFNLLCAVGAAGPRAPNGDPAAAESYLAAIVAVAQGASLGIVTALRVDDLFDSGLHQLPTGVDGAEELRFRFYELRDMLPRTARYKLLGTLTFQGKSSLNKLRVSTLHGRKLLSAAYQAQLGGAGDPEHTVSFAIRR